MHMKSAALKNVNYLTENDDKDIYLTKHVVNLEMTRRKSGKCGVGAAHLFFWNFSLCIKHLFYPLFCNDYVINIILSSVSEQDKETDVLLVFHSVPYVYRSTGVRCCVRRSFRILSYFYCLHFTRWAFSNERNIRLLQFFPASASPPPPPPVTIIPLSSPVTIGTLKGARSHDFFPVRVILVSVTRHGKLMYVFCYKCESPDLVTSASLSKMKWQKS